MSLLTTMESVQGLVNGTVEQELINLAKESFNDIETQLSNVPIEQKQNALIKNINDAIDISETFLKLQPMIVSAIKFGIPFAIKLVYQIHLPVQAVVTPVNPVTPKP